MSEDPARRGTNWVAYCSNSPTCGVDRNGRDVDWINTVFNGPEWFIDGLKSSWQEGIEQFIEFIEEHWQFAVINFAAGRSATIAGELMLRLYVNELDLAEAAEMGKEIGGIEFYAVDADAIGGLISGAADACLVDLNTGGYL